MKNRCDDGLPPAPVATGRVRTFKVQILTTVTVAMDEAVIDEVDNDNWRNQLYDLHGPDEIAKHLAFNHLVNHVDRAEELDGFARLAPGMVTFDLDRDVFFEETIETTPCPFTVVRGGKTMRCIREHHTDGQHTIKTKKGGHKFVREKTR